MVWPCEPISAIFFVEMRKRRQAVSAASAKVSPRRKLSWLSWPAEMGCCSATRRISLRSCGGKRIDVWFSSLALRRGGAPEMRARATSMASAEVPDIRPRTRDDLGGMCALDRRFQHRGHGEHREENRAERKKTTWKKTRRHLTLRF